MSERSEYPKGYEDGFRDGWEAAKNILLATPINETTSPSGCAVCGIGKNGEAMNYVCYNPRCPTKVAC